MVLRRTLQDRARCLHSRCRQRGAIMILYVAGLVAILGIAGLALDGGHGMLSKSRLQNTVDAAALSGAKTLDQTGDTTLARAAALAMFSDNANVAGNREIAEAYANGSGSLTVTVEFSSTLNPFVPGTAPAEYVRVRTNALTLPVWFSVVLGITDKGVAARAVAGPSPTIDNACNLLPMMVCGDPDAGGPYWGYAEGQPQVLKGGTSGTPGVGNFQLIRLGDNTGAADIREAMAGGFDGCAATGDVVPTEPGNSVGPVAQGLNTRFGTYLGPMAGSQSEYPPDVVTEQPIPPLDDDDAGNIVQGGTIITDSSQIDYAYAEYQAQVAGPQAQYNYQPVPSGIGQYERRIAPVVIGDCTNTVNGQGDVPVLGIGCFFLLQEVEQGGGPDPDVFGEFLQDCNTGGNAGPAPTTIPGPHVIQLYRDFASTDS